MGYELWVMDYELLIIDYELWDNSGINILIPILPYSHTPILSRTPT
jgi:hypothetical protein